MASRQPPWPRKYAAHIIWLAIYVGAVALVHSTTRYFVDGDTGYHLAVARLTSRLGILHSFPWTPFSWLAEHYADKEFLFHMMLVPLSGFPPAEAARIAGTILGAGILASIYFVLYHEQVEYPGSWALLTLVVSMAFVFRIVLVRPHLVSISLTILVVWSAACRRYALLTVLCFVFPLAYTAWHLPLILVALVGVLRYFLDKWIDWKSMALCVAGAVLGNLLHPNFPENLRLFWVQNYIILLQSVWGELPGLDMGGEFNPFRVKSFFVYLGAPLFLLVMAGTTIWRRRKTMFEAGRRDLKPLPARSCKASGLRQRPAARSSLPRPVAERRKLLALAYFVTAVLFLILTIRTQRFAEYFVPFSVLAAAVTLSVNFHRRHVRDLLLVIFLFATFNAFTFSKAALELMTSRDDLFPAEVARQVERIVPSHSQVVTCDWRFTGEMMLALPDRNFMVALDPVFFAMNEPVKYRIWFDTIHSPPQHPAGILHDTFNADYVMCLRSSRWIPFLSALDDDPRARRLHDVGRWTIFEIDSSFGSEAPRNPSETG